MVSRLSVFGGFILFLIFSSVQIDAQMSRMEFPELIPCSCDGAYRCLSDQDYMELVSFFAQKPDLFAPFICKSC